VTRKKAFDFDVRSPAIDAPETRLNGQGRNGSDGENPPFWPMTTLANIGKTVETVKKTKFSTSQNVV